ncbi:MAG: PAS domain S-box protein [Bdellovibrionales bacterium]|nr:PAS domain S-box protein [Bdellovibrionales bacterium]
MAHNVVQARGRAKNWWLSCAALAMGFGIWSMHFIGMLAFEMPDMAMAYDVPLMVLSILVAIGASALALFIISRDIVPMGSIISGGVAMAAAIAGMHYIGMYSMRMSAVIQWNVYLVVLSVLTALGASFGALFVLIRLRSKVVQLWQMLLASVLMGFAIAGMHYIGMLAATFVHTPSVGIEDSNLMVTSNLTFTVIAATLFILGIALASSMGQKILNRNSKRARDILGQSEERFRRLVEAVKEYAIFMLDAEGNITTWNSGAERITGYSEKEILGRHLSIFYTPEERNSRAAEDELRAAKAAGHFECEAPRVRKDGSVYWANVVLAALYDGEGNVVGFSKVTRDITQSKESQRLLYESNEELEKRVGLRTRALEQRERQLRTITDAVPVLLAQLDLRETFLFANEAFCEWTTPGQSVVGKQMREVLGEENYQAAVSYVRRALQGEVVSYERQAGAHEKHMFLNVTLVPEFESVGVVSGLILVATDITKHKEIEAELKRAKESAEVANATKSAFLANMSHEIRTPLGAVLGFSELLIDDNMSASERLNSLEVIKRNGRLLSTIINDILDLSKVEAGRMEIEIVEVVFSEVMTEIGSVLNLKAAEKGIALMITSEGVVPSVIKTDPSRLRQVLLNVVGNAIKFTNQGTVHVRIKTVLGESGRSQLAFSVTDSGEGIAAEQIERLFTPFTQADASTTRRFGGTGLGLALSRKLAMALGGDVKLTDTALGKGSTFTVTIDLGITEQLLFHSAQQTVNNVIVVDPLRPKVDLRQMKVLIVDDSVDNQILISKILRLAGASVEIAGNGREAVEKASRGEFSLILMDLQMPEMDGYEATKILRQRGFKKPIIALTAHAMKEERQRSLRSGFDDHITKPIDHEALIRTLAGMR